MTRMQTTNSKIHKERTIRQSAKSFKTQAMSRWEKPQCDRGNAAPITGTNHIMITQRLQVRLSKCNASIKETTCEHRHHQIQPAKGRPWAPLSITIKGIFTSYYNTIYMPKLVVHVANHSIHELKSMFWRINLVGPWACLDLSRFRFN
jgi:hypothetical protein